MLPPSQTGSLHKLQGVCVCVCVVSRGTYCKVCLCTSLLDYVHVRLCDVILRLCWCGCVPAVHSSFSFHSMLCLSPCLWGLLCAFVLVSFCVRSLSLCACLCLWVCACVRACLCVCVYVCETVWTHQHLLRSCCGTTSDRDQDTGLTQACSLGISAGSQRQLQNVLMTSSSIQAKWVISVRLFWMCCLDAWHPGGFASREARPGLKRDWTGLFLPSSVHSLNIALSREGSQRQCIRHPNTDVIFFIIFLFYLLYICVKEAQGHCEAALHTGMTCNSSVLSTPILQNWGSRSHWF